ncbi:MAG TPA: AraC family transcriptional regulator [Thermoanaerobaculia bacterium]
MAKRHDRSSEILAPRSAVDERGDDGPEGAPSSGGSALDTLSDVLEAVRLTGALFFLTDATTPWVAAAPEAALLVPILLPGAQHVVSYHVVTRGACWCRVSDLAPVRLGAGDIVVIPHGDPYLLTSAPELRSPYSVEEALEFFRQLAAHELPAVVPEGGGGEPVTHVFCGFLGCDVRPFNPVLATLPKLLLVRCAGAGSDDALAHLVALAMAESRARRAGGDCVLLRLSELLFVEVVRRHIESLPPEGTGWLAALRDPVAGRALVLLHGRPAEPWTLDSLARAAAVSRSVLAERFAHLVGEPPMRYLARWRMQRAARLLADSRQKVAAVAQRVGYESEAAFSRAFKKLVGEPPAAWRRRRAAAQPTP